jgi:hypothetical protein
LCPKGSDDGQANDRWINAHARDYYYIIGASTAPDKSPCDEAIGVSADISFTYDREAAAHYAIAHAYRNSYSESETGIKYPGWYTPGTLQARATNRIRACYPDPADCSQGMTSYLTSGLNPIFIPYIDRIPFAEFLYNEVTGKIVVVDDREYVQTASAVFPSQAIWMGGLPWTYNAPTSGTIDSLRCQDSDSEETSGWRFCSEALEALFIPVMGYASVPWKSHGGLTQYYSKRDLDVNGVRDYNNVLKHPVLGDQRGQMVAVFDFYVRSDANFAAGGMCDDTVVTVDPKCDAGALRRGFPNLDNPAEQEQFYTHRIADTAFLDNINDGTNPDDPSGQRKLGYPSPPVVSGDILSTISTGDYVTIPSGDGHGFLVVGWGPIMSCPAALENQIWLLNDETFDYYKAQADHKSIIVKRLYMTHDEARNAAVEFRYQYPVPYVVDFPGSIDQEGPTPQVQLPQPRPFYCAAYNSEPQNIKLQFDLSFNFGFFRFYEFPDTIVVRRNQIYPASDSFQWNP